MSPDARPLRERLQQALGDAYLIERELGGGMSRVFAARELRFDRRVVVKVLPPELGAALNTERFQREIALAARLQHPHIVPVHAAGEVEGIPYYTMPFIEGESLRQRLQGGPLSIGETARILHDVADALAYAHERGVVHRDIKPDNILLTRGHAVVTDFGVAKALSLANTHGWKEATTGHHTAGGLAIGTPAYMAPEQAAGDPTTDHRADVYALGVVGWEMLAGRAIFGRRAAHELLAAQIAEHPSPVDELRPDAPRALCDLVMRCLEKHPGDRPQSATDVGAALDALAGEISAGVSGSGSARRPPATRAARYAVWGAAGAAMVALAAGVMVLRPAPGPVDEELVAVVPFHVSGDPALRYLREGMLDLLAAKLTGEGGPRSAEPRAVLAAWRREAGSDTADLPRERVLALAEGLRAGHLLTGDIGGDARHVVLRASMLRVRDGRAQVQADVAGPVDSLPQLVDQLAGKLLALRAGEGERLPMLSRTPLPALRSYLAAQWLYRRGRYREAGREYAQALDADSTFTLAAIGLVDATGWVGDGALRQRAARLAWAGRDGLAPREQARLAATLGPRYPDATPYREQLAATQRYVQQAPDRPEAWFSLGDNLFHFGWVVGLQDAHERAADAFHHALALDSTFAPALEHLVLIEARRGDSLAARRAGESFLALDSASESAQGVRWRLAALRGDRPTMEAITQRASELRPTSVQYIYGGSMFEGIAPHLAARVVDAAFEKAGTTPDKVSHALMAHDLALARGRPREAAQHLRRISRVAPLATQMVLREQVKDALYWDGDTLVAATAAAELARLTPAAPPPDSARVPLYIANVCTLERWRLAHRDTSTARRSVAAMRSVTAGRRPHDPLTSMVQACAITMDAQLAVIQRSPDAPARVARLDSLLLTGPMGSAQDVGNLVVAQLKEATGDVDGALEAVRRREYIYTRSAYLSTYLREEGRLAALTGDVEGAIAAYRQYLAMRDDPESPLDADVEAIRAEVARLEREGAGK